ncbi:hypothetical protein ACOMHN_047877 [Nucella lapillus]
MIQGRKRESEGLTGMGVAALGEGIAAILFNAKVVDTESVLASSDAAESGSEAVKRLFNTKPFPIGARLNDAAFSMCGLLDRLLAASVPTYDLSVGANMVINSSDFGEDVGRFMVSRVVLAAAVVERRKIITTHTAMPKLITTINTLQDSLMIQQVLGQPPTRVHRGGVTLAAVKVSGRTLGATNITVSDFDLNMDSIDDDDSESDPDKVVDVKACVLTKNPYAWSKDGSSYEITSPVVRVNLTDKKGQRKLRKLTMKLKRGTTSPVPQMETYSSDASRGGPDGWWYHHFSLRSGSASVVIFFSLPEGLSEVVAYFRSGRWPTKERYDVRKEREKVSDESLSRRRRAAVQNATTPAPNITFKGPIYKFFVPPGYLSPGRAFVGFQLPELGEDDNITRHYNYMGFSDTCRVWDDERETWDPSACSVSGQSDAHVTVCECENPPGLTFASSFFLAPTTIDFSSVFAKFDITNAAVYGTLIGLALVWVLALLWARRKDRRDKERWLVGYLKDNLVDDGYFYLVTVHTGIRRGAGTLSNVKFILTGQLGDTGVRVLSDGKRTLETGSMMCYILATTQRLGDLRHLRVWHDDSGPMGKSAWYLSRMTADDLQTGERFIFICEKWLALDKDEGLIDRVVPVTMKDEVMTFDKLFSEHARLGVTDTHLWLSCLLRPERSAFTRKQRVSCCLALLLLTMITSAMFYQPEDSETGESTNKMGMEVTVGIMKFSMTTLWTSFVSIAITSVPIIIFVALFRSCRPRWGPRAEAQKHRRMGLLQMTKSSKRISEKGKGVGQGKEKEEEKEDQNMSDLLDDAFQKNPLPHLCVYLTWLLLLGSMAACAFFLMLYSMQWGKTTSEEWLASFFLSFFESIFVVDPIKVLLLACLLAYCAGNPYFSTQHQHVDLQRVHTEAETFGSDQIDPTAVPPDPIPDSVLEAARKRREQEQLAQRVFFELVLYSLYVFCVFAVSYGHRDQNTYHLNSHLSNLFYARDGNAPMPFESRDVGGPRNAKNAAACHAYTRDQLLACKQTNAHPNPSVINRLKELSIGYRLPRHRSCRGGTRKRRQIPVVVSQRRSQDNTLFLPDCVPCTTPTPPPSPDVSLCSTARPSRANLQNLIKVPLQSSDLPNQLYVCLFNAKSVGVARKRTAIADFLADHDVDVMVLTETWLKESGDESKTADLTPPGYKLFSFPRQLTASIKGGGGIAVIMKDCLVSHTSINTTLSFTHTSFEISTRKDVMTFINQTIREVAFPLTDMTGQELNWKLKYFSSDLSSFRVGPVRVRQVRMPKREKYPKVTRMYPSLSVNSESFPPYHMEAEETGSYCLGWKARGCTDAELTTKLTLSSWKYEANVTDVPVWGIFAFYPSGGYLVDFVINRAVVSNMIEELYENTWLDLQTKAVFVEMVLYNPNNNLFTFLRMATEFPEVGSNIIWKDSKTLRIYNHLGALGAFNLICELSLVLVVLIFTFKFIIKIKTQKCAYLKDFWQVLDLLSLIISYAGIVTYVVKSLKVDEVMAAWRYNPKAYVDFYLPLLYDDIYGLILAALVFVVTIRLLRVLGYNKRITMIATVLSRSGSDLFGFFVVFFIVLTAYMMAGLILFAATMYQFRSVWDSYCTLYLVLLGKNVLGRFIGEAPLWAQAYYCSLTILVVFILYTMFQAILCNTTSIVRADIATVPPPYGLVNVLEKFYRATIADWVPAWFVKTPKTVAPETMAPSASAAAGVKAGWIYPVARMPHYQQDVRTQPHRVLATLSDHFSRFYQGEETKAARRKRKMAFTNISKEKTAGNKETGF